MKKNCFFLFLIEYLLVQTTSIYYYNNNNNKRKEINKEKNVLFIFMMATQLRESGNINSKKKSGCRTKEHVFLLK